MWQRRNCWKGWPLEGDFSCTPRLSWFEEIGLLMSAARWMECFRWNSSYHHMRAQDQSPPSLLPSTLLLMGLLQKGNSH